MVALRSTARFYTHFTFRASVICATSLTDVAGWMRYTQLQVRKKNVGHER
jgi:hypothetical protein